MLLLLTTLLACTDAPPGDKPDGDTAPDTGDTAAPECDPETINLSLAFEAAIDGRADPCQIDAMAAFLEIRKADVGPWNQEIRVAFSEDTETFEEVEGAVISTAAVPEVLVGPDGRYYLYYVDGDFDRAIAEARAGTTWMATHGIPGLGALNLAVSDNGVDFELVPEFQIEGVVRGMVVDPDVVLQPDGSWRMYYVGMSIPEYLEVATWEYPEAHDVFYATSDDLVHWKQQGVVVRGPYADPSVLCRTDDTCVMASFGVEWGRSTDGGLTFTHEGDWGVGGFAPEFLRMEDQSVRLFFNSAAQGAAVLSMYAIDGETFVLEPGERLPDHYGEAVTLARVNPEGWNMYYHTFKDGFEPPI
ncbi:MAG: hypothetical protein ACK4YP_15305 [Myxococcota bacterium]